MHGSNLDHAVIVGRRFPHFSRPSRAPSPVDINDLGTGLAVDKITPSLHERPPALKLITAHVRAFSAPDLVRQRRLDHLTGEAGSVTGPSPKADPEAVHGDCPSVSIGPSGGAGLRLHPAHQHLQSHARQGSTGPRSREHEAIRPCCQWDIRSKTAIAAVPSATRCGRCDFIRSRRYGPGSSR